ncbi:hypothetical protein [Mucilaginibacter paludis]|uniref:Uncharacterized protein n=1 Tax=Mucilaginibacter paludis DSM 18603 TaxID=714943 RepID=H1Y247_9SPHI|nr:hypothetical protein [Mucilaginibacter paludis]EHQ26704.1 hypothetical protein Mucpa_2589 [Mucilaginibacter paludis DSM 18603]
MANTQFLTFRKFNQLPLSEHLVSTLIANHIEYEVEDNSMVFNPSFINSADDLSKEYLVKIKPEDFDSVNELLVEEEAKHIDEVDPEYYLFGFTDDELMDILINYNEWNAFDFALARKILNGRGHVIDDQAIKTIQANKLKILKEPEKTESGWIIAGYLTALMGGLFGIFIGWYLSTAKKTLPNGQQVYTFLDTDRKHGNRIFFIGIVVLVGEMVLRILHV